MQMSKREISLDELEEYLNSYGYKIVLPQSSMAIALSFGAPTFKLIGADALFHAKETFLLEKSRPLLNKTIQVSIRENQPAIFLASLKESDAEKGWQFLRDLTNAGSDKNKHGFTSVQRCVMVFDIADFTTRDMDEQVLMLSLLHCAICLANDELGNQIEYPQGKEGEKPIENTLFTGDGYIFVLYKPNNACVFAALLAHVLELLNSNVQWGHIHFRLGLDYGKVHFLRDFNKNWNYVGDAINNATRVLSTIGPDMDDVVYVSHSVYCEVPHEKKGCLFPMGRRKDKHASLHRVYHLNYHSFLDFETTTRLSSNVGRFIQKWLLPASDIP